MAKKKPSILNLGVSFGGVSIGDGTCRIGVSVDREQLTVERADAHLCGCRLTGIITPKQKGEAEEQGKLPGMDEPGLEGTFDVKGFKATEKKIGFNLTFAIRGLDVAHLCKFAKRDGKLVVNDVGPLPEGGDSSGDDDADEGDDQE